MRTPILLAALAALAACSASPDDALAPNEVAFHAEQELLPGFRYDTGLQPQSGPVQLQLVVSSAGTFSVDAIGIGIDGAQRELVGKAGSGKLVLGGGLKLDGHLKVDQSGLPKYDGDIPGLADAAITFAGTSAFDPFLLASKADVSAPVVGKLPSIPLPGGLPGTLDLQLEEGTKVDFSLNGTCASLADDQASYHAALKRSGTIRIKPVVTLKVPVVGNKSFALPVITIALPTAPTDVDLGTHTVTFGGGDSSGEHATLGACGAVTPSDPGPATSDAGTDADAAADADADAGVDADADADAGKFFPPASGSCSADVFTGKLLLIPDGTGTMWNAANLTITGPSNSTHNNATIWSDVFDFDGTKTTVTKVKVLDTTDDYIANGMPRAIANFVPRRRTPYVSNGHTYSYSYYAEISFDKNLSSDPKCTTVHVSN